jgi:hypothetical protein
MGPLAIAAVGCIAFVVLATANAGGYRTGTADQAFYIPAVYRALDARAFPRDSALIDAQARLMVIDELTAFVMQATGISLELLYLLGYLLSLLLFWVALGLISDRIYRNRWGALALAAAITLRYRIPRTSANTFEPYFHPRMLGFAFGAIAIAAILRRAPFTASALVAVSLVIHPSTGLWFAVLVGVAIVYAEVRSRPFAVALSALAAAIGAWMTIAGPLPAVRTTMDPLWLQAVSTKDSLFPTMWPLWAWVANFAFLGVLLWAHRLRQRRELASREDTGLVLGAVALVVMFVVTLPFVTAGVSLFVQLQVSRVFWLVAFLATVYLIAAVTDSPRSRGESAGIPLIATIACLLLTVSVVRGAYVMRIEHPERALFAVHLPQSPWQDAMDWLKRLPISTHVLADPGHAWKYGTSVRVSAGRDVLLEDVKDSSIAIYSREVGHRVVDRTNALGDFSTLDAQRARTLAKQYDLNYLVTDADLPLPLVYRNSQFRIYALDDSSLTLAGSVRR